ncbi:MAG: HIT domain-containing protein [Lachnospiraceae bacterium]
MHRCLFCEFISGETPCKKAYEDDMVSSFIDWNRLDGIHVVAYPRKHIGLRVKDSEEYKTAHDYLYNSIPKIVEFSNIADGYELLLEDDERSIGQDEEHLHIHIIGKLKS